MTDNKDTAKSVTHDAGTPATADVAQTKASGHVEQVRPKALPRDPETTLQGCERIVIIGRTGSGKTTLARQLAAALDVPHVELDALYFGPDFSTAPVSVLRERVSIAIAGDRWITDGNKSVVRDLVWPRADTIIWLDYPLFVSLWRLARRALGRASSLTTQAAETGERKGLPKQFLSAARGVLSALRSHTGQRSEFPRMLAAPENQHLETARLRSPRATQRWLTRVAENPGVEP